MLLILIPAMMTAVGVAREKETGSIANFRSTPITEIEFLLGKQLPYVAIGLASFPRLLLTAIYLFGVLIKGSLAALIIGIFHLRRCGDGLRPADLLPHLHSDRRHFHNNDPDPRDRDKFLSLLVPFLSLSGAALWHCRRHPITVVCRPRCAACAALRSDAVIHRRERPLRDLSRRARHSPGDLYGHDGAVRWAGGPGSGYSQPVSGSATPLESMPDWLIEVMKITPTPHFVSFSQSVLYRAAGLDIVWRPRRHYDGIFWHLTDAIQDHNCRLPYVR